MAWNNLYLIPIIVVAIVAISIGIFAGFKLRNHFRNITPPKNKPRESDYDINMEHLILKYDIGTFDALTTILRENKNTLTQLRIRETRAEGRRSINDDHETNFIKVKNIREQMEVRVEGSRFTLNRWSTNIYDEMINKKMKLDTFNNK